MLLKRQPGVLHIKILFDRFLTSRKYYTMCKINRCSLLSFAKKVLEWAERKLMNNNEARGTCRSHAL